MYKCTTLTCKLVQVYDFQFKIYRKSVTVKREYVIMRIHVACTLAYERDIVKEEPTIARRKKEAKVI